MATNVAQISQTVRAPGSTRSASSKATSSYLVHPAPSTKALASVTGLNTRRHAAFSAKTCQVRQQCAARAQRLSVSATTSAEAEVYDLVLDKPIGLKFTRGTDGGCYVLAKKAEAGPDYDDVEVGDKVVKISASFGEEVWEAENYGQVMYAMKTRSGGVYIQFEKKYGDLAALEPPKSNKFQAERAGGNYGAGTAELQRQNYSKSKTLSKQREDMFREGLTLFNAEKYDQALVVFENVVGLEPKNYIGDNMSKVTDIYRLAQYNVACCYSMINQIDAGVEALEQCLRFGYEDYKQIRKDPSLATLRESELFTELINKYDEPFINENAFKAIKSLFGRK